jgi:hypothetical protein
MMNRADGEKHRHRDLIVFDTLIGENDQPTTCVYGALSFE